MSDFRACPTSAAMFVIGTPSRIFAEIVVEAELPGVKRENVNIELVGDELTITGEIKERESKGTVRRRSRRTGRFDYRVSLPDHVDADQIEANLVEGILTVHVPKSERAQRQRIELKP